MLTFVKAAFLRAKDRYGFETKLGMVTNQRMPVSTEDSDVEGQIADDLDHDGQMLDRCDPMIVGMALMQRHS